MPSDLPQLSIAANEEAIVRDGGSVEHRLAKIQFADNRAFGWLGSTTWTNPFSFTQ